MSSFGTLALGFSLILFLFSNLLFKTLGLWFNLPWDMLIFFLSLAVVQVFIFLFLKDRKQKILVSLFFYILLFVSFYISVTCLDLSFDGNWYQKEPLLQLKGGWNPLLSGPLFQWPGANPWLESCPHGCWTMSPWIDYFPKAAWFIGSVFYNTFEKIEISKAPNIILLIASYFLTVASSLTLVPDRKRLAWGLGLIAALNPISIQFIFTLMVDGALGSLCLCWLIFLVLIFKRPSKILWCGFIMTSAYIATLKTSGFGYVLIALTATAFAAFLFRKQLLKGVIISSILIGALIGVIGFNPYVTNLIHHGSLIYPFEGYPLSGITPVNDKGDHYTHLPDRFKPMNRFEKFFSSLFSASSALGPPQFKIPFTVRHGEAASFSGAQDVRIGGFGPLFGGAFILSFLLLALSATKMTKKNQLLSIYFPASLILVLVFANPENSWARYIPQTYLLPVYSLGLYIFTIPKSKKWKRHILPALMALTLFINAWIVTDTILRRQLGLSGSIDRELKALKGETVLAHIWLPPLRSRLDEYGIKYRPISIEESQTLKEPINVGDYMFLYKPTLEP